MTIESDQHSAKFDPYFGESDGQIAPALWGWAFATLVGLVVVAVGTGWINDDVIGNMSAIAMFPVALIFTSPALLMRACLRFSSGLKVAVPVGVGFAAFMMPVTYGAFQPISGRAEAFALDACAVYIFAGALAGAVWWKAKEGRRK